MRRLDVRQVLIRGWKRIVQKFRFRSYMALPCLLGKWYGFSIALPVMHPINIHWQQLTRSDLLPCYSQFFYFLREKFISWFWTIDPSAYVPHQLLTSDILSDGYLLIEFIEESRGSMLSSTWEEGRHDSTLQSNLFNDLSQILLNLARFPLPRIGSFIIDNKGFLCLTLTTINGNSATGKRRNPNRYPS